MKGRSTKLNLKSEYWQEWVLRGSSSGQSAETVSKSKKSCVHKTARKFKQPSDDSRECAIFITRQSRSSNSTDYEGEKLGIT